MSESQYWIQGRAIVQGAHITRPRVVLGNFFGVDRSVLESFCLLLFRRLTVHVVFLAWMKESKITKDFPRV